MNGVCAVCLSERIVHYSCTAESLACCRRRLYLSCTMILGFSFVGKCLFQLCVRCQSSILCWLSVDIGCRRPAESVLGRSSAI